MYSKAPITLNLWKSTLHIHQGRKEEGKKKKKHTLISFEFQYGKAIQHRRTRSVSDRFTRASDRGDDYNAFRWRWGCAKSNETAQGCVNFLYYIHIHILYNSEYRLHYFLALSRAHSTCLSPRKLVCLSNTLLFTTFLPLFIIAISCTPLFGAPTTTF